MEKIGPLHSNTEKKFEVGVYGVKKHNIFLDASTNYI